MEESIDQNKPVDLRRAFRSDSVDVISCYNCLDQDDMGTTFVEHQVHNHDEAHKSNILQNGAWDRPCHGCFNSSRRFRA